MIADFIVKSQEGNSNAIIQLVKKFNPLLKKYAYRLYYEDAYNDLLVDFIDLLHRIKLNCVYHKCDGSLVSYISKSIRSSYIKKSIASKMLHCSIPASDLSENELYYLETTSASCDEYFKHEIPNADKLLTKSEKSVIQMIFLKGYSVYETAQKLHVSRQAINQMKKRALKKLKPQLLVDKL